MGVFFEVGAPKSSGCSKLRRPTERAEWRHIRPACASLALAFAMLAPSAQAQDNDGTFWLDRMNQIVVTATRTPAAIIKSWKTREPSGASVLRARALIRRMDVPTRRSRVSSMTLPEGISYASPANISIRAYSRKD